MNVHNTSNKRKVALFQRVGSDSWFSVWYADVEQSDDDADESQPDGYVRISQYVVVEFPPLEGDVVVEKQLQQLDRAEQEARVELQQKLNQINDVRQKLLALTFRPAA
jgi:hypothetical protein